MHRVKAVLSLAVLMIFPCCAGASLAPILFQEGVNPDSNTTTPDVELRDGATASTVVLDVGVVSAHTTRSLISFNLLDGLQSTDQIGSISLQFTTNRVSSTFGTGTVGLYTAAAFTEATATWSNNAGYDSSQVLSSVTIKPTVGDVVTVESTSAFVGAAQDALENHNGLLNLILVSPEAETASTYVGFNQSENATSSNRPLLSVSVVPEPASLGLLGLGGLLLLRRRHKQ
jgi:hypothetical protein